MFDRTLLTSAAMLALIALAAWGLARRERALARSWRRYQAMIEHSSDALILSGRPRGGILYASPAIGARARLHPRRPARPGGDRLHPPRVPRAGAAAARRADARAGQGLGRRGASVLHKDGSWRWIELTRKNLLRRAERARGGVQLPRHHRAQAGRGRAGAARAAPAPGRRSWRRSGASPAASRTTSTTSSAASSATPRCSPRTRPPGSPLKRYADNVLTGANRASGLVEQILSYSRSQRGKRAPVDLGARRGRDARAGARLASPGDPARRPSCRPIRSTWWATRPSSTR